MNMKSKSMDRPFSRVSISRSGLLWYPKFIVIMSVLTETVTVINSMLPNTNAGARSRVRRPLLRISSIVRIYGPTRATRKRDYRQRLDTNYVDQPSRIITVFNRITFSLTPELSHHYSHLDRSYVLVIKTFHLHIIYYVSSNTVLLAQCVFLILQISFH